MKLFLHVFFLFTIYSNSQMESIKSADQIRIKNDLIQITQTQKSRNFQNIITLDTVANYIKTELAIVCDSVAFQPFLLDKKT